MAMRAVQVIAAGQAGLQSLPYFIDEFIAADIPMIEPYAIDHSDRAIEELQQNTATLTRGGTWTDAIYKMSESIGVTLEAGDTEVKDTVSAINPRVDRNQNVADAPAYIAAAIRRKLPDICGNTLNRWRTFKADHGIGDDAHLAVVIPYCPEGPTSGTSGTIIGAALREHFRAQDMGSQLTVWGIEMCPPLDSAAGAIDSGNTFRGYVARDEICNLGGVPISRDVDQIDRLTQPFDINLVIDGGMVRQTGDKPQSHIHEALDLIAAQITAVMLNGPAGDAEETRALLQSRGGRWNGIAVHVISSVAWDTCSRYWKYRRYLPWFADGPGWDNSTLPRQREQFVKAADTIVTNLEDETDEKCADNYRSLAESAKTFIQGPRITRNKLRTILLSIPTLGGYAFLESKNLKKNTALVRSALEHTQETEESRYQEMLIETRGQRESNVGNSNDPSRQPPVTYRMDMFCVNAVLNEQMQRRAALEATDEKALPLAELVGSVGVETVQQRIMEQVNDPLERKNRAGNEAEQRSSAYYDRILTIRSAPKDSENNGNMAPSEQSVKYLLSQNQREGMNNYTGAEHHPDTPMHWEIRLNDRNGNPQKLTLPVEMTYIALAQPRPGDGFRDVSTYDKLETIYQQRINEANYAEIARYYSGRLPVEAGGDPPPPVPQLDGADI